MAEGALKELGVALQRVATQDLVIEDLQNDLTQVQDIATRLGHQLGRDLYICDDAWVYGYVEDP